MYICIFDRCKYTNYLICNYLIRFGKLIFLKSKIDDDNNNNSDNNSNNNQRTDDNNDNKYNNSNNNDDIVNNVNIKRSNNIDKNDNNNTMHVFLDTLFCLGLNQDAIEKQMNLNK